jgi:hypothetical protein
VGLERVLRKRKETAGPSTTVGMTNLLHKKIGCSDEGRRTGVANGTWHIESHYPTQAKERLGWGTPIFVAGMAKTNVGH